MINYVSCVMHALLIKQIKLKKTSTQLPKLIKLSLFIVLYIYLICHFLFVVFAFLF